MTTHSGWMFGLAIIAFTSSAPLAPVQAEGLTVSAQRMGVCTREYRPVCARRNGRLRTYSNRCTARAAGARVIFVGRCR